MSPRLRLLGCWAGLLCSEGELWSAVSQMRMVMVAAQYQLTGRRMMLPVLWCLCWAVGQMTWHALPHWAVFWKVSVWLAVSVFAH